MRRRTLTAAAIAAVVMISAAAGVIVFVRGPDLPGTAGAKWKLRSTST